MRTWLVFLHPAPLDLCSICLRKRSHIPTCVKDLGNVLSLATVAQTAPGVLASLPEEGECTEHK